MNCAPANVSMRVSARDVPATVQGSDSGSRRDQRDGVVQRSGRRAVAREPLASSRRAARRVGLQGLHRLRLLRDLGARLSPGYARAFRLARPKGILRARGEGRREHRAARTRCYAHLVELVREGTLAESELDDLVAPMLYWKFRLGLFDDPYVDPIARRGGRGRHRRIDSWRCAPRARRSRCSRTTMTSCRSTCRRSRRSR